MAFASKVVIIDEVHAYDAYMSKYLSTALYWLGQMNAPVILMSATLPSDIRNELMKSYAKGLKIGTKPLKLTTYSQPTLDLDYPVIHTLTAEDNGTPKKWKVEQPAEQPKLS